MVIRALRLATGLLLVASTILGLILSTDHSLAAARSAAPPPALAQPVQTARAASHSPLMFVENVGQFAPGARFQALGADASLYLAQDSLWFTALEPAREDAAPGLGPATTTARDNTPRRGVNLRLSFDGANPKPQMEPLDRLETKVSYFLGSDPSQWRPEVPVWGGVRYHDLYPGVDMEVTSEGGRLVQRLVARPGADLAVVSLRLEGADGLALGADGLHLSTALGEYRLPLLEMVGAEGQPRPALPGQPRLSGDTMAAPFADPKAAQPALAGSGIVASDASSLVYSALIGGNYYERGTAVAVDAEGAAYTTGYTYSSDFPATPGAFDTSFNGGPGECDVFVAKLNAASSALIYATFVGGSDDDDGPDIALDGAGNAYITGSTESSDFPTTPGAFESTAGMVFVVKLDQTGSSLSYATRIPGTYAGNGIAVDGEGNAYVAGTSLGGFPVTPGAFDTTFAGFNEAFVAKLNPTGSALVYGTYLGGNSYDETFDVTLDKEGNAYLPGYSYSSDFPTTPGAFNTSVNGAFLAKLNAAGSDLVYSTSLGGDADTAGDVAVDETGAAYVLGWTRYADFPVTPGAIDTTYNGGYDVFVAKVNPAASDLVYATFLGGDGDDSGSKIAVDGAGNAYITGYTTSVGFPTTPGAFDTTYNDLYAGTDVFVSKLDPTGGSLLYSTFLGTENSDWGGGIAIDEEGFVYVAGAAARGFPVTPGAFGTTTYGAFVVKMNLGGSAPVLPFHTYLPLIVRN
ncbi:MAG: SBBP repeat-containing protein [Chloroflexota bacterium]